MKLITITQDFIKRISSELKKNIQITKETKDKVFYEVSGFTGCYNKNMSKAPTWFTEWNKNEFRPLVKKVDQNTESINKLTKQVKKNTVVLQKHFPEDFK